MTGIFEIKKADQRDQAFRVIKRSFATVAEDLGFTRENAPTNPAFITREDFQIYMERDLVLFGLLKEDVLVGCAAIEQSPKKEGCYYIERLAVVPEERCRGYGKQLLDYSIQAIKDRKGNRAEIGIIHEHAVLKNWYLDYGFTITGTKKFDHLPFEVCFMAMDV